jgi:hypothetical protein
MIEIDPRKIPRDTDMQIARAVAIEEYASVESAMSRVFAALLGTTDRKGSIVFFAIVNTRSRNSILEALLEDKHGKKYDAYWYGEPGSPGKPRTGGLITLIRQLDDLRNHIVHWHPVRQISQSGTSEALYPPHFWHRAPLADPITHEFLIEFAQKANFVYRSLSMFYFFTTAYDRLSAESQKTWLEIFARPAIYPPSSTHPISPNYKAPESPPRSSGE